MPIALAVLRLTISSNFVGWLDRQFGWSRASQNLRCSASILGPREMPHIHGELIRLGFTVAQSTVAKYMPKPGDGRSGQAGAPSCATICRILPPWICSWSRP
jgi:hypothetical protein